MTFGWNSLHFLSASCSKRLTGCELIKYFSVHLQQRATSKVILETLRAELAVGFIGKEKRNESAKIVFIKGRANVHDDFYDADRAGARASGSTAQEQPAPGGEMFAARPRIDVPV